MNEVVALDGGDDTRTVSSVFGMRSATTKCTKFHRRNTLFFSVGSPGRLLQVNLNFDNQCFPDVDESNCVSISPEVDVLHLLRICIEENIKLIANNVLKESLEPVVCYMDEVNVFEIYPIASSTASQQKVAYPILINDRRVERLSEFYLDVYYIIKK